MNPFDIVKAARALQTAQSEPSTLSPSTKAEYERISKRLIMGANSQIEEVIRRASDTTHTKTWFKRRAALQHSAHVAIRRMLAAQDQVQRRMRADPNDTAARSEWLNLLKGLNWYTNLLNAIPAGCPIPTMERSSTHSKKKDLQGLPPDWREVLLARMHKYYMHFLVTACTGCRPIELAQGVDLRVDGNSLIATVKGRKVTNATPGRAGQGQPWRELRWVLPKDGLVDLLAQRVCDAGGALTVKLEEANGPTNFSTSVRDAARREWPARNKTVTPYCIRHAFSADLKAARLQRKKIAAAMGHAVDTTCQCYGTARQVGRSSVAPDRIDAARAVREKYVYNPPRQLEDVTP